MELNKSINPSEVVAIDAAIDPAATLKKKNPKVHNQKKKRKAPQKEVSFVKYFN